MHITFSEDGKLFVSARSRSVRLWRLNTPEKTVCSGHRAEFVVWRSARMENVGLRKY